MAGVPAAQAGLASGLPNVSQQVAGALGLAVRDTVATGRTRGLLGHESAARALTGGDHLAHLVGTGCVLLGLAFAVVLLRARAAALAAGAVPAAPATRSVAEELSEPEERAEADAEVLAAQPV